MIWIPIILAVVGWGAVIGLYIWSRARSKKEAPVQKKLEDVNAKLQVLHTYQCDNARLEQEKKKLEEANAKLELAHAAAVKDLNKLRVDNNGLVATVDSLGGTIDLLNTTNEELQAHLQNALATNVNATNSLDRRGKRLEGDVIQYEGKLRDLQAQIESRTAELNDTAAAFKKLADKLTEVQSQNAAASDQLAAHKKELENILEELNDAREAQRQVRLDGKDWDSTFDFDLSNKEIKLIETLKEIAELYPELAKDLAGIEWKKIWLSKMQELAGAHNLNTRGIYRLVLKEDENVSYVGQAANIDARWREHIKKMVGADNKGAELLYRHRPEEFYWTVLERNVKDLNTAEHYWIEYYCCKERGLNKKR